MDERLVTGLRAIAGVLVFVTAAYHLQWGLPRALIYLQGLGTLLASGVVPDPRPFLFVAFAGALFVGPYLVTRNLVTLRRGYQLGMLAMVLSILAWMFWHITGHGAFLTPGPAPSTLGSDHTGVVTTVLEHYLTTPIDAAIKTSELAAAMAFGALLRWDPAVRPGD